MQVDRFGGGSFIVSGGIHFRGKTNLVVVRQNMNAQRYCNDILRPVVIPFMNRHYGFVFQQDNARPHTTRLTAIFCRQITWTLYLDQVAHPILPQFRMFLTWGERTWKHPFSGIECDSTTGYPVVNANGGWTRNWHLGFIDQWVICHF